MHPPDTYLVDPADLRPELREVRDYWNAKRGARLMPRRADIDPFELRRHLPYLSLLEPLAEGRDFRFRLLGTGITELLGRDSTGKTVLEVYASARPEVRKWMIDTYAAALAERRPVFKRGTLSAVNKGFMPFEALHMPLSENGERVTMLFGRTHFMTSMGDPQT